MSRILTPTAAIESKQPKKNQPKKDRQWRKVERFKATSDHFESIWKQPNDQLMQADAMNQVSQRGGVSGSIDILWFVCDCEKATISRKTCCCKSCLAVKFSLPQQCYYFRSHREIDSWARNLLRDPTSTV